MYNYYKTVAVKVNWELEKFSDVSVVVFSALLFSWWLFHYFVNMLTDVWHINGFNKNTAKKSHLIVTCIFRSAMTSHNTHADLPSDN